VHELEPKLIRIVADILWIKYLLTLLMHAAWICYCHF